MMGRIFPNQSSFDNTVTPTATPWLFLILPSVCEA
jgi:hypothetical protein